MTAELDDYLSSHRISGNSADVLQFKQDVACFVAGGKILIVRRGRSVSLPSGADWEAVVEGFVRGTTEHGLLESLTRLEADPARVADRLREAFAEIGALQQPARETSMPPALLEKHSRTLRYFAQFETPTCDRFTFLERLREARVLVLGLGGAGSWIAYQLLLAGVGHVRAADGDVVEASNLNRTALLTAEDVGAPKAAVLQKRLGKLFPEAALDFRHEFAGSPEDIVLLAQETDMVIGAADMPHRVIREWVSTASLRLGIPSIQTGGGRVGPFFYPGRSSCAGCLQASLAERARSSGAAVTDPDRFSLVPTSAMSGHSCADATLLVHETVRHLAGHQEPVTLNRVLQKGPNLLDGELIDLPPRLDCRVGCGAQSAETGRR